jgi:hypothetical protein
MFCVSGSKPFKQEERNYRRFGWIFCVSESKPFKEAEVHRRFGGLCDLYLGVSETEMYRGFWGVFYLHLLSKSYRCSTFLRNVSKLLLDHAASYRQPETSHRNWMICFQVYLFMGPTIISVGQLCGAVSSSGRGRDRHLFACGYWRAAFNHSREHRCVRVIGDIPKLFRPVLHVKFE